ncbi:nicotinate-nucleotide--dimethylbenzimidazole phosphoribosyltransferase, partial [Salmonella enterica]|uniref:nicotinate-nucleotide--dimethylbenzimidazole phosphoribosyltransferase n=1 Tax=Salmonella enterica TaxID=28901 RepID=UPI003296CC56
AKVGGFQIGANAALINPAAAKRKPVVEDGFISTAGAMFACRLEPFVRDYLICAHRSTEPGHTALLEVLKQRPLLDL